VINVQACAKDSRPCRQIVQFVTNPCAQADSPTFALSLISVYTWQLSIYDCNNLPFIHTSLYILPYIKIKKNKKISHIKKPTHALLLQFYTFLKHNPLKH
jgi:hypothetical protein